MKKLLLLPLIACGDMMTELPLDKEFYEWYCVQQTELDPIDKVHISTKVGILLYLLFFLKHYKFV